MSRSLRGARSALANWLVLASGVVAALHLGKAAIATPMLQTDMGLSLAQAGWLTSVFAVLGLLGGAPAGALAAVMGRRTALLLGLAIMALSGFAGAGRARVSAGDRRRAGDTGAPSDRCGA